MARSTRSGTLVGPGICRKCRPLFIARQLITKTRRRITTEDTENTEGRAGEIRRGGLRSRPTSAASRRPPNLLRAPHEPLSRQPAVFSVSLRSLWLAVVDSYAA